MVSYNTNTCYMCNAHIRNWITLCNECRDKRNYYAALVSTWKKRLKELLNKRELNKEWLERFKVQTKNIVKNSENVLTFKRY